MSAESDEDPLMGTHSLKEARTIFVDRTTSLPRLRSSNGEDQYTCPEPWETNKAEHRDKWTVSAKAVQRGQPCQFLRHPTLLIKLAPS